MTATEAPQVSEEAVAAYRRDGAVFLQGHFTEWLDVLTRGVARNMANPSPIATEHQLGGGKGRFFEDYCSWQRIPEYRDFVLNSSAASIAARFMGAKSVRIFHEHVLVKEAGTTKSTVWHHDMPYYCVRGRQNISIWIALDPVPISVSLRFVAGSHRWGKLYYPRLFDDGSNYDYRGTGYETVPDIDGSLEDYRILTWELAPGDAVLFDFLTLHGAPGNLCSGRRCGFSTRWLGDDARYAERPGTTSPPFPGIGLKDGDLLRDDWFPVVWTAARRERSAEVLPTGRPGPSA